jgi:hypothetical protein
LFHDGFSPIVYLRINEFVVMRIDSGTYSEFP